MVSAAFDYQAPSSVEEALELLSNSDDAKILAGGHSLIPMMKLRLAEPGSLIDLGRIEGLSYVNETADGGLAIGPMTSYYDLVTSDAIASRAPLIAEAAAQVADPQVRNMGTIGGSLSHADPAGDLPAVAIALNAQLVLTSSSGSRTVSADDFFIDLFTTALQPNEILTEIQIPAAPANSGSAYAKMANKASHYAIVGAAVVIATDGSGNCVSASVGITGAGPSASRASESESRLVGSSLDDAAVFSAAGHATDGIELNEDVHASAEYREHLTKVYALRAIRTAIERASG